MATTNKPYIDDTERQAQIFQRLINRHLWIKCVDLYAIYRNDPTPRTELFVRPKSVGEDTWGCCEVNGDYVQVSALNTYSYKSGRLNFSTGAGIRIAKPREVCTTQKLFGIDADQQQTIMRKIAGKNLWVLASSPRFDPSYIKINTIDDYGNIFLIRIPKSGVEYDPSRYFGDCDYNDVLPSESFSQGIQIHRSKLKIDMPPEILSDSELFEMLKESDEQWKINNGVDD